MRRLSVIVFLGFIVALILAGGNGSPTQVAGLQTATSVAPATPGAPALPTTPPVIEANYNGNTIQGVLSGSCWPQSDPKVQPCIFPANVQTTTAIKVANGDSITFVVTPNNPSFNAFAAKLPDDNDASGNPIQVNLVDNKGVFKIENLTDGDHTLEITASYPGDTAGASYYVEYTFKLSVQKAVALATGTAEVAATGTPESASTSAATPEVIASATSAATASAEAQTATATAPAAATELATPVATVATVATTLAPTTAPTLAPTSTPTEAATLAVTSAATPIATQVATVSAAVTAQPTQAATKPGVITATPLVLTLEGTVSTAAVTKAATSTATVPQPTSTSTATPTLTPTFTLTATQPTAATATITATIVDQISTAVPPLPTISGNDQSTPIVTGPIAPVFILRVAGFEYSPIAVTAIVAGPAGEQITITRPITTTAERVSSTPGSVAQLDFKGPRPTTFKVTLYSGDGTTVISTQSLPADNLGLYTLPAKPGTYVVAIAVTWPTGQALYYYRVTVNS